MKKKKYESVLYEDLPAREVIFEIDCPNLRGDPKTMIARREYLTLRIGGLMISKEHATELNRWLSEILKEEWKCIEPSP